MTTFVATVTVATAVWTPPPCCTISNVGAAPTVVPVGSVSTMLVPTCTGDAGLKDTNAAVALAVTAEPATAPFAW